jgi:hypothetical protein
MFDRPFRSDWLFWLGATLAGLMILSIGRKLGTTYNLIDVALAATIMPLIVVAPISATRGLVRKRRHRPL